MPAGPPRPILGRRSIACACAGAKVREGIVRDGRACRRRDAAGSDVLGGLASLPPSARLAWPVRSDPSRRGLALSWLCLCLSSARRAIDYRTWRGARRSSFRADRPEDELEQKVFKAVGDVITMSWFLRRRLESFRAPVRATVWRQIVTTVLGPDGAPGRTLRVPGVPTISSSRASRAHYSDHAVSLRLLRCHAPRHARSGAESLTRGELFMGQTEARCHPRFCRGYRAAS